MSRCFLFRYKIQMKCLRSYSLFSQDSFLLCVQLNKLIPNPCMGDHPAVYNHVAHLDIYGLVGKAKHRFYLVSITVPIFHNCLN